MKCAECGAEEGAMYPYTGHEVALLQFPSIMTPAGEYRWCSWSCWRIGHTKALSPARPVKRNKQKHFLSAGVI